MDKKKAKTPRSERKSVRKLVAAHGGPFRENPEVYKRHAGMHGNLKQYFSVLIEGKGVLIFTYDDSEEFLPAFIHFFDVKEALFSKGSPLGSSLSCVRSQELIVLSTEPAFKEMTFPTDGEIVDVVFSPQENFLCLLRCPSPNEQYVKLEIRETKTGNIRMIHDIESIIKSYSIGPLNFVKWSYDDHYFASLGTNRALIIYETKTFSRVKPLILKQVRAFSWSPSASLLAVCAVSCIKIVDVCSGKVLYANAWKGEDAYQLFWEGSGDYLACMCIGNDFKRVFLVCLKSGKSQFITPRGRFIDFAWRGNGKDFAVTQGTGNGKLTAVKFYTVREDEKNLRLRLETVEDMIAHYLHWSPNGQYMVMKGPGDSGELYFYDVDNHQRLSSATFISMNLSWDSTSRFFLTQAHPKNWLEPIVRIWSSHGVKLIDVGPLFLTMLWGSKLPSIAGSSMNVDVKEDSAIFKRPAEASGDISNCEGSMSHGH